METATATTTPIETTAFINALPREERIARLTPERRALYERIARRRERAGAVEQDIGASLKELRDNG